MKTQGHLQPLEPDWGRRLRLLLWAMLPVLITLNFVLPNGGWWRVYIGAAWSLSLAAVWIASRIVAYRKLSDALVWRVQNRCTTCGYDLTGNTSGVCPECGTAVPPPVAAG